MGDYTFFTFDGGGNQPPTIGIALELKLRGHQVRVVGYESQRPRFEMAGLRFTSFPGSGDFQVVAGEPAEVRDAVRPEDLQCPANARIRGFWPHRHVMPEVSVCVTHGGHATLVEPWPRGFRWF